MTEVRKHAILFAATLLCARKLIETIESDKPNPAKQYFVDTCNEHADSLCRRRCGRWNGCSQTMRISRVFNSSLYHFIHITKSAHNEIRATKKPHPLWQRGTAGDNRKCYVGG
jgi:hypothetical protein